jgi:ABC-type lipoprotein release transport system permease subunit
MPIQRAQEFVIENVDGGTLSISRFEFFRVLIYNDRSGIGAPIVAGVTLAVIGVCALIIVVYVRRAAKKREETDGRPVNPSLSRILC